MFSVGDSVRFTKVDLPGISFEGKIVHLPSTNTDDMPTQFVVRLTGKQDNYVGPYKIGSIIFIDARESPFRPYDTIEKYVIV
jgi:hypothetical protein